VEPPCSVCLKVITLHKRPRQPFSEVLVHWTAYCPNRHTREICPLSGFAPFLFWAVFLHGVQHIRVVQQYRRKDTRRLPDTTERRRPRRSGEPKCRIIKHWFFSNWIPLLRQRQYSESLLRYLGVT